MGRARGWLVESEKEEACRMKKTQLDLAKPGVLSTGLKAPGVEGETGRGLGFRRLSAGLEWGMRGKINK